MTPQPQHTPANRRTSRTRHSLSLANRDLLIAPLAEAALLLAAALFGVLLHRPLLFASLGPTAYELVETPASPGARPYSILLGHAIAILSALLALWLTHAAAQPTVSLAGGLAAPRITAAILAAALTVFFTLLVRVMQPAAVSTALLLALGSVHIFHDAPLIFTGVLLITALGEPLRRWRLRSSPTLTETTLAPSRPVL